MASTTAVPGVFTESTMAALSVEWQELLVDAAGGDRVLAALTSARLQRAATNPPTLEETQLSIQGFFELETEQAAAVVTKLAAETAPTQKETPQAA